MTYSKDCSLRQKGTEHSLFAKHSWHYEQLLLHLISRLRLNSRCGIKLQIKKNSFTWIFFNHVIINMSWLLRDYSKYPQLHRCNSQTSVCGRIYILLVAVKTQNVHSYLSFLVSLLWRICLSHKSNRCCWSTGNQRHNYRLHLWLMYISQHNL